MIDCWILYPDREFLSVEKLPSTGTCNYLHNEIFFKKEVENIFICDGISPVKYIVSVEPPHYMYSKISGIFNMFGYKHNLLHSTLVVRCYNSITMENTSMNTSLEDFINLVSDNITRKRLPPRHRRLLKMILSCYRFNF
jgi:hypothetical protein